MYVIGGVGAGASHQLHLVSCAFPFHVSHIDSWRLHSGEQMADGSENLRPLGGGGRQGGADIPLAGHPEGEAGRCAGVPLSLSGAGRQHLDGHVAVLCETVHWPAG